MSELPTLLEMLKAGVHFGHQQSKWHPKMKPFIYTSRNGIHIINLEETEVMLKKAMAFISETVSRGGIILFVGSKNQAKSITAKYAKECGMPYINERWLGGTLTNFATINKLVRKFRDLKRKQAAGELDKYTKKEQLGFKKEIAKLDKVIGGIENMDKMPDAVYIVDIKQEETALYEAVSKNIPIIATCDTNVNPDKVDYIIPANDDATKAIDLITSLIARAVTEGKAMTKTKTEEPKK